MFLAQGHKAVTPVRLEIGAPRSRVKHSTTVLPDELGEMSNVQCSPFITHLIITWIRIKYIHVVAPKLFCYGILQRILGK